MMQRFLLLLCVSMFACISLDAQSVSDDDGTMTVSDFEKMTPKQFARYKFDKSWPGYPKFEVRVGYSGAPVMDVLNFGTLYHHHDHDWGQSWSDVFDLDYLYAPQSGGTAMTGNIMGEFSWHAKKWFTLAGALYVNGLVGTEVDPSTSEIISRDRGVSIALLPVARFYWRNYEKCRLYSAVGLGVNFATYDGQTSFLPTFQFSPIGITAGRKVFFFAEYTFGFTNLGGQFGIGYRF